MSAARARRAGGFTLLELLVALAVMAILAGLMGGLVVSALASQKRAEATLLRERVGSAILDLFARDLAQVFAYGVPGALEGKDEETAAGEADSIAFVTCREAAIAAEPGGGAREEGAGAAGGGAGAIASGEGALEERAARAGRRPFRLSRVSYFLRESRSHPGLMTLFRAEQRFVPPPPSDPRAGGSPAAGFAGGAAPSPDAPVRVFEVFDRVRLFKLEYLDPKEGIRDGWTAAEKLPKAVRVTLEVVPDPAAEAAALDEGRERARRIYQTIVAIEASVPEPREAGAGGAAGRGGGGGGGS